MLFASPRLTFRRWRPDDEALARLLWGDPEVTKLFTKEPLSDEEVIARLRRECAREQELGFQYWPMFAKAGGDLVGCCGFAPKDHDSGARHELGFHLRRAHWGRGYATEAARAALDHAFAQLGATVIFAGHHPDNAASAGVLRKLGFVAIADEIYPPTGQLHPSYLLRREAYCEPSPASP